MSENVAESSSNVIKLSSATSISVLWKRKKAMYYSFHTEGPKKEEMIEFNVTGTVVDAFLSEKMKSHTDLVNVNEEFIERVKKMIRTASGFRETGFRWPFESEVARFNEKEFVEEEFPVVWDDRGLKCTDLADVERREHV